LAEKAVAGQPRDPSYLNTLGAALYRAGRYEEAVRKLDEAVQAYGQEGQPVDWLFLAMAHHRQGRCARARGKLGEVPPRAGQNTTPDRSRDATSVLQWTRRVELELIRREAEALVRP